jgi:hypothetical protein
VLPCVDGLIAPGIRGDGAVEEINDPFFVEHAGGIVQGRVAGDHHPGLACLGMLVKRLGQRPLALRA